jgi:glucan 1,3-beta-glucosidase
MGLATVITALLLATGFLGFGSAVPTCQNPGEGGNQPSSWWFAQIEREGKAVYAPEGYKVFRNVKDYGAAGDGTTDDTDAINAALAEGPNRCLNSCDSRTSTPAIVYFPPGEYLVSRPLVPPYYTHMVGDVVSPPTLKASAGFQGIAVIDANPYVNGVMLFPSSLLPY